MLKLRVLASFVAEDVAMVGENLEGDLSIINCARGFSDFASAAFAENFTNCVIIDHFSIVVFLFILIFSSAPLYLKVRNYTPKVNNMRILSFIF